jgi:NADPH:quinone reductase-like Zn-dependent oxidoreductase
LRHENATVDGSQMTTAVVATAFGGPEVLSVIETPVGSLGAGEVLIEVRAAGTNPIDYKAYSGAMGRDPAQLPMRLGREAAGVVTAVADGAQGPAGPVQAGDEVIAFRVAGAYAGAPLETSLALVAEPDRVVTLIPSRRAFDSGITVIGGAPGADPGTDVRAAARLELARLGEEGRLRVLVAATYPFAEASAAHRALATGHTHGKIVLVP